MLKPNAANALIAVALGFAVILAANVLVGLVLMLAGDGELEPTAMVGPGLVVQGICMMFFVVRWARATEGGAEQVLAAVPATRWWLVLFIVLPWGVRQPENRDPSHADGAPERPMLLIKFAVTTVITGILFTAFWFVADAGIINFRS